MSEAGATPEPASATADPKPVHGRPTSLVRRLVLLAVIWSIAVLAAAGAGLTLLFHQASLKRLDNGLVEVVDNLLSGTTINERGEIAAPALTDIRALRVYSGRYWEIAVPAGARIRSVVRSRSLWDADLKAPPGGAQELADNAGKTIFYNATGPAQESLRIAAIQARLPGYLRPVIFLVGEDRRPVDQDVRTFAIITVIALIVLGIGLIIAVIVQVRVGLGPLFALQREVSNVRTGKTERLAGTYPPELQSLSEELNALVEHNQDVVERQRTHVGNLAHALKTPISVMLTEASQRPGPMADLVTRQAGVMQAQVDHHLRRARAAARAQGPGERTPVAPVLEELARTLERIFRSKGVVIDWRAPDNLIFHGERQDLLEIAGNVMENACKWSTGRVRATATPLSSTQFELIIEDDGPGIPADEREEVLERGARLDELTPGSGLGLSIVDELARAYEGSLSLGEADLGGLKARFVLPRAEA